MLGVLCMRLGLVELAVISCVASRGGYATLKSVKGDLSEHPTCTRGLIHPGEFRRVSDLHCSILHAVRRLEGKGILVVGRKGKRVQNIRFDLMGLAEAFLLKCDAGRRCLG